MLRDLTIKNYRTFKEFSVDGLAQVNLLVGKNNSGKTSLLEAIYLLVRQNNLRALLEVMDSRGERYDYPASTLTVNNHYQSQQGYQTRHLFHDRQLHPKDSADTISLSSHGENSLSLQIHFVYHSAIKEASEEEVSKLNQIEFYKDQKFEVTPSTVFLSLIYGEDSNGIGIPSGEDGLVSTYSFQILYQHRPDLFSETTSSSRFLTTDGIDLNILSALWDEISLTPKEEKVIEALQVIEPTVERIGFTSNKLADGGIRLKLRDQSSPVPLGSMGDGMRRILNLAIALVSTENGVLLVDEIDTGLHYQAQTDMWRLVIETAKRLNVQVFATTHSWDCVCAFQEALGQTEDPLVGKLLRLSQRGEDIQAVAYTADELEIAVRQGIEVR
jgi:ABC-type multidrug transport system ATPase subunit